MPTMRRSAQRSDVDAAAYKQLLQGSQWFMHRRFEAKMTDTDLCQMCKEYVGTEHHMGIGCNHVTRIQERDKYLETGEIERIKQGFGGHVCSTRGILSTKWLPLTLWWPKQDIMISSHP